MPIYEYRCKSCDNITEFLMGIGEDVEISCSQCGGIEMEKVMSTASFLNQTTGRIPGQTCCGRQERCDTPQCSTGDTCRRDRL